MVVIAVNADSCAVAQNESEAPALENFLKDVYRQITGASVKRSMREVEGRITRSNMQHSVLQRRPKEKPLRRLCPYTCTRYPRIDQMLVIIFNWFCLPD